MKRILFYLMLLVSTFLLSGCIEDLFCDPGPYYADLKVKVTINDENPIVPVVIYLGKFEKRDTLISVFATESTLFYELEAGNYYSATASYTSGIREVLAIDGKWMDLDESDGDCPSASNITLRLGLSD